MAHIRIIGGGISGSILALRAHMSGHSIDWWKYGRPSASLAASGIYNPIVLKRLKLVWRAAELARCAEQFYADTNALLGSEWAAPIPIWHRIQEQGKINDWEAQSADAGFVDFLGPIHGKREVYGELKKAGRLLVAPWLDEVEQFMAQWHRVENQKWCVDEHLDGTTTVLCMGWKTDGLPYGIPENAMAPVKGEVLTLRLPGYPHSDKIVHGGVFIMPLRDDLYKVGATYSWDPLDERPSDQGKEWLLEQLSKLWPGPVEQVGHEAAVRPAVRDRKPILGAVGGHEGLYVFNGMGSRGTLLAPLLSQWMLDHMFHSVPLPSEVDLGRFSE